ncbi:MAG: hypothetical protein AMXMBFR7_31490 [Planctomycetota bacterium]
MAAISAETVDHVLWVTGTVDRSSQQELGGVLDEYLKGLSGNQPVIDLSNVKYFSSSAAKSLLVSAQDIKSKGRKLKIRSSLAVAQTLNMLGAQSWVEIEACPKPNPVPAAMQDAKASSKSMEPASSSAGTSRTVTPLPGSLKGLTGQQLDDSISVRKGDSAQTLTAAESKEASEGYRPKVHIKPVEQVTRVPVAAPASASGSSPRLPAIGGGGDTTAAGAALRAAKEKEEEELHQLAYERAGQPLARIDEELPEKLLILRKLLILNTYTFTFTGGNQLTGKLLTRLGGSWILIEQHSSRRWINLEQVCSIDVL